MTPAKSRAGLGRGLGDLLQRTDVPQPDSPSGQRLTPEGPYFAEIPIDSVDPNPRQPRTVFAENELAELVDSIREVGLLQPVVVTPAAGDRFELVMGERRLRAMKLAGKSTIPTIVRVTDESSMLRDALLENLHRAQLNPLEEAAAYQQLLDDFQCTHEELAKRILRSRSQITNTIRLLKLPAVVQKMLAAGELTAGHARALLKLSDPEQVITLADRIVKEGLSVRTVETLVATSQERPSPQPKPATAPPASDPKAELVSRNLATFLNTKVSVSIGSRKGKIVIEFTDQDELDRIVATMSDRTSRKRQ